MVETLKYACVSIEEVIASKLRLEANYFNVEARKAKEVLKKCKWDVVHLWSNGGLIKDAFYPGRFRRIYVAKEHGYSMLLPSQMREMKPQATKYISEKTFNLIGNLKVELNSLLITRSGTIGNCTIVSKWLDGFTMSDDIIRIKFQNEFDLGFVYTYLLTEVGKLILATNNYGSVIQHIEPEHLENVLIPNPEQKLKEKIHNLIIQSFSLRDKANEFIEKAEKLLIHHLKLPPIESLQPDYFDKKADVKTYSIKLDILNDRLDGSYHDPISMSIIDCLLDAGAIIKRLDDKAVSQRIIQAGRFKRNYVESEYGTIFLGGKQILELDPTPKKYLSTYIHSGRVEKDLFIEENMIAITRSGTIGKVQFIPAHWNKWAMSEHVLRIVPSNISIAGYIYIWLQSVYGNTLIERLTYGAVVDEIEKEHLAEVPIPILKDKTVISEINDLALEANKLRSKAYYKEQDAIKIMNEEVIYAT